jgi:hypothetical protein
MSASKGNDMTQLSPRRDQAPAAHSCQRRAAAWLLFCAGLALAPFLPAPALADVPPLLPIQGYLTDKQGAAINGSKSVSFRLYTGPIGGTSLHEETIQVVAVDGYFTVYLGDDSQHPLDLGQFRDSAKVFLGIEVEKDGEGLPRLQVATTAFAARVLWRREQSGWQSTERVCRNDSQPRLGRHHRQTGHVPAARAFAWRCGHRLLCGSRRRGLSR